MSLNWNLTLLYILVVAYISFKVHGENLAFQCEVSRFSLGTLFQREGVAMKGHVKKSTKSPSILQCGQLCLSHLEWCVSVNFELAVDGDENSAPICELNDRGVASELEFFGSEFEPRNGYIYSQIRPVEFGCLTNPCQNGVTCYNDCASLQVKCRCKSGYTGKFCETEINECSSVVCQHGGTCQDLLNNYTCSCVPGYTGRHCETNINECAGVVCQNGGTCQDLVNAFSCTCIAGYTGQFCETDMNECAGVVCQNGGTCHDLVNAFNCTCIAGYTGQFCETDINECAGVVCQNGGVCQDLVNAFKCICVNGYSGQHCEKSPVCEIDYPSFSTSNYILYPFSKSVSAITVCGWYKLSDSRDQYPFSYTHSPYSIGIGLMNDGRIVFKINGNGNYHSLGILRDSKWQHLCIAWQNTDGTVKTYRNGGLVSTTTGFKTGNVIGSGGDINIGRRSDFGSCFMGTISNLNAWSTFLTAAHIQSLASTCQLLDNEGDLVKWSEVKLKTCHGSIKKSCPGTCTN